MNKEIIAVKDNDIMSFDHIEGMIESLVRDYVDVNDKSYSILNFSRIVDRVSGKKTFGASILHNDSNFTWYIKIDDSVLDVGSRYRVFWIISRVIQQEFKNFEDACKFHPFVKADEIRYLLDSGKKYGLDADVNYQTEILTLFARSKLVVITKAELGQAASFKEILDEKILELF
jgi:hypothetical protein